MQYFDRIIFKTLFYLNYYAAFLYSKLKPLLVTRFLETSNNQVLPYTSNLFKCADMPIVLICLLVYIYLKLITMFSVSLFIFHFSQTEFILKKLIITFGLSTLSTI